MIRAADFWIYLKSRGYIFCSGVPCSTLKELLECGIRDPEVTYLAAVKENAALGIASGAYLAGRKACLFMQNSGIGNIVNALTSFNLIYKIPVLMLISWRGFKGKDAPEHLIMGKKTLVLLKDLQIPYIILNNSYKKVLDWAIKTSESKSIPVAVIIRKGQIE